MRLSFEPGDGSFEIWLEADEALPAEWAKEPAAMVLRTASDGHISIVKHMGDVLPEPPKVDAQ